MRPRPPLILLTAGWAGLGLAASWSSLAAAVWPLIGTMLATAALADMMLLLRTPSPRPERFLRRSLPQAAWSPVELSLRNPTSRGLRLECHDCHPGELEVRGLPRTLTLGQNSLTAITYHLRPPRRGCFTFAGCDLALHSPLRLWRRRRHLPLADTIRVYPNLAEIGRYRLLAAHARLSQLGIHRRRNRGSGTELHQLRDYRRGDSLRQIDWKASARMGKPIAREYQEERDQRLIFLLDCGRRMRHCDAAGRAHLDDALNALLLLAYVALRQGDAVGVMTYGGPRRWLAPRQEPHTLRRILQAVFDLQPGLRAADPLIAARELLQNQPRRALVVMITNSRDEDHLELSGAVHLLRRQHLLVIADLREAMLDTALEAAIKDRDAALRFRAVQSYLEERRAHHKRLRHQGAILLDLLPHQLPVALVNQYFAIKQTGAL